MHLKDYTIAFLIALCLSCLGSSNSTHKSELPVRVSNITENRQYPAKMEEWTIGELEIRDENGPNRAVTGISENGSRSMTKFPFMGVR